MNKILVYLSGDYRHFKPFFDLATSIWAKGYAVYCPQLNCDEFVKVQIDQSELDAGNLEILSRCDVVYLMPKWNAHPSALLENSRALAAGITVVEDLEALEYFTQKRLKGV